MGELEALKLGLKLRRKMTVEGQIKGLLPYSARARN
jgi:hypothetical protein